MNRGWFVAGLLVVMPLFTAQACGPDFYPDVFVRKLRPDHPKEYATGKLGILLPTFPRADLIVAFRYLNGGSLSPAERAAYQPLYIENEPELAQQWRKDDTERKKYIAPAETWSVVSIKYAASPPKIEQDRVIEVKRPGGWTFNSSYLNCTDNAFQAAVLTLHSRAKTWGEKSPELVNWVKGQDTVFANCTDKKLMLPPAAPAGSSALLKADRAYQTAAAQFYAGHFDDARKAFEAIGQDSTSPWHGIAQYLAARCLVRQAFLSKPDSNGDTATYDGKLMRQAAELLQSLLKGKPSGISRQAIDDELNLVRLRIEPNAREHELAAALAGPKTDSNYNQHLQDLTWFLNANLDNQAVREDTSNFVFLPRDQEGRGIVPTPAQMAEQFSKTYIKLAPLRSSATLVDWLVTFQSPAKETKSHALDKWKTTHQLYWLLAAISKATEKDADAPNLITEAEQVPPDSPAWESLTYHRVRLLIALGRTQEARTLLDQVMSQIQAAGRDSSVNAYLGLRMSASVDLNEFLGYAPRKILVVNPESQASLSECLDVMRNPKRQYDCKKGVNPIQFSADTASFFNTQAPLSTLVDVATSNVLPEQLRRSVAMMAWVRSVLLKDDAVAVKLFPLLPVKLQQESGDGTGFRALVAIIRNPGLRPYLDAGVQRSYSYDFVESYADNWWCKDWQAATFQNDLIPMDKQSVSLLTTEQRNEGEQEAAELEKQESADIYMGGLVLSYAKDHPDDTDVPESLYLVLRMIRYGCGEWGGSDTPAAKEQSRKIDSIRKGVARLLRQRYAASPWTKKSAPFV